MFYNILLIDDNPKIFHRLEAEWKKYGGCLTNVSSASEGVRKLPDKEYHIIAIMADYVKDMLLPAIKVIRETSGLPILVLTSRYDGTEKMAALRCGADEYLLIRGKLEESIMSGVALSRRYAGYPSNCNPVSHTLSCRSIHMDLDKRTVSVDGRAVELSRGEFNCLELLLSHPGKPFTHEIIYYYSYGEEGPSESILHSVRNIINRIRWKFGEDYAGYVKTVRGIGYSIEDHAAPDTG